MGIICVEGCGKRQGTRVGGGLTPLGHYLTPSSGTLRPGDISYAPLGLGHFLDSTHGLRRGLHSFAAPRLPRAWWMMRSTSCLSGRECQTLSYGGKCLSAAPPGLGSFVGGCPQNSSPGLFSAAPPGARGPFCCPSP